MCEPLFGRWALCELPHVILPPSIVNVEGTSTGAWIAIAMKRLADAQSSGGDDSCRWGEAHVVAIEVV